MRSTGKKDATCGRLTSPGTPAILRGVGRILEGPSVGENRFLTACIPLLVGSREDSLFEDYLSKTQTHGRKKSWQNQLFMNVWAASSPSPP